METQPTADQIRAAIVDYALRHGYSGIPEALGITRSNLNNFLHGSKPQRSTLARMHAWYAEHYAGVEFAPLSRAFGRLAPAQLETIRHAVQERVTATNRLAVARSVGMVSIGLLNFLNGSPPNSLTAEKLRRWYAAEIGTLPGEDGAQDAGGLFGSGT